MIIKYLLLALLSTTIGAITGMGGGVIIKPFMDFFGDFDAFTIAALTSITVFSMAIVAVAKQSLNKKDVKINIKNTLFLGIGSVIGGYIGQLILEISVNTYSDSVVKIFQNALLFVTVILIMLYIINKNKIRHYNLKNFLFYIAAGIILGVFSTILGIGGGPLNVALLMLFFNMNIKTAVVNSLVTKMFSQGAKILTMAFTTGFAVVDLSVLPYMIVAGIAGAFAGSIISKKCSDKAVSISFQTLQIFILALSLYNIVILI